MKVIWKPLLEYIPLPTYEYLQRANSPWSRLQILYMELG